MDPNLNNLLKWSLANSSTTPQTTTNNDPTTTTTPPLTTDLPLPTTNEPPLPTPSAPRLSPNAAALASLLSGPSDATLMRAHLATLTTPTTSTNPLPTKLLALAGLEQLLESIDNVNALSGLGLWPALVALLGGAEEAEMRRGAAACVGTAVQNNAGAQGCVSFLPFLSFVFLSFAFFWSLFSLLLLPSSIGVEPLVTLNLLSYLFSCCFPCRFPPRRVRSRREEEGRLGK